MSAVMPGHIADLPDPLVPDFVDLRHYPGMILDVGRILRSRFVALSSGDGYKAASLLWYHSWHEVPAGSLPNEDSVLAYWAGLGKSREMWEKIKAEALYGWVLCSDGRLYHPVIAQVARKAAGLPEEGGNLARNRTRESEKRAERRAREKATKDEKQKAGQTPDSPGRTIRVNKREAKENKEAASSFPDTRTSDPDNDDTGSHGRDDLVSDPPFTPKADRMPIHSAPEVRDDPNVQACVDAFAAARAEFWGSQDDPRRAEPINASRNKVAAWLRAGATADLVIEVITSRSRARSQAGQSIIGTIGYFDGAIRDELSRRNGGGRSGAPPATADIAETPEEKAAAAIDLRRILLTGFYGPGRIWPSTQGPPPGRRGCRYTPDDIRAAGWDPSTGKRFANSEPTIVHGQEPS